jgi:hypothetical protein
LFAWRGRSNVSDEFAQWYRELTDDEHESVNFSVDLLEELGPSLGRPHVDTVRFPSCKYEGIAGPASGQAIPDSVCVRPTSRRLPYPCGDKTGDANWYKVNLKKADEIYDAHLREIKE